MNFYKVSLITLGTIIVFTGCSNSWTDKQIDIYRTTPTNRIVMENIVNEPNKQLIVKCFEKKLMSQYTYTQFVKNMDSDYFLFREIPKMTKECIKENK